ncbi:hypothetical protein [Streptomyces sp. MK37H]|uniref:hypothetical protein n=1 Tax=Streptomyces sp. MK37H TaxID=2699117 RepID=UPI001B370D24|nr:hypothetical protein [Streptomyces sp. MK37H]MBP8533944.1 hypothetical protein [Streptomyces sp. MK37H]
MTDIATNGVHPSNVEVMTIHNNIRYTAATLADLIAAVEGSSQYDDRVPWVYYGVTAEDSTAGRTVGISVTDDGVEVEFYGADQIWVAGQFARLEVFLQNRNGSLDPRSAKKDAKLALGAMLSLAFWLGLSLLFDAFPNNKILGGVNTGLFAVFIGLQLGNVSRYIARHATARGKVAFTVDMPVGSYWSRMDVPTKLLFLTLIVTAIAAVATGVSAAADVIGIGK